jgi:thioredoxin reductase (NADPH)
VDSATADTEPLDALIIGAGPAGLTAGLYLQRYHRRIAVVDRGGSRAEDIAISHNVPGFPQGIPGRALLGRLRQQLHDTGGQVQEACVDRLVRDDAGAGYTACLAGGTALRARHVLLATGAKDVWPALQGTEALRARGLLRQCPICDGHEHRGQRIAVLGAGAHGLREALFIRHFSGTLLYIDLHAPAYMPDADLQRQLDEAGVQRLAGTALRLQPVDAEGGGVRIATSDGREHQVDVMYAALGAQPASQLAIALGAEVDALGNLVVDGHGRTSVQGVYAAGDVTAGLDQICVATGQAAIAATAIHNALR